MCTTNRGGYVASPGDPNLATVQPGELIIPGSAIADGSAVALIRLLQGGPDA